MVNLDEARSRHCADPMTSASDDVHRTKKGTPAVRSATLVHLIEVDIIPRLLIANGWQAETAPTAALEVETGDIDDFARMMMSLDLARANLVIAGAREQGVSMESIMLNLFAPTANRPSLSSFHSAAARSGALSRASASKRRRAPPRKVPSA